MSIRGLSSAHLRRWWPLGLGVAVVAIGIPAVVLARWPGSGSGSGRVPTFTVQEGPLTISVIESGTIKSQDQISLKSEVEGQTTLIYLIPEGTRVEEGTLLAELDASQLQDEQVEQQIRVDNAEASFIQARENLAVVQNQAEADKSKAQLTVDFAKLDRTKYVEGEREQKIREADSKITIAREEMERAAEKLSWSERLLSEKYISNTEFEADRLTHKRAELDYELAVTAKALLLEYTDKRQQAQLDSDVTQAEMALDRTKRKAAADIAQAEAQDKAKEAELALQRSKLDKIKQQIAKSKIRAPREGLVVYATSTRTGGGRGGMTQPLEEGQSVRERQELIYLPSTQAMMAELMIHESSLEKVQEGQPVHVTVDALPGRTFTGRVRSIAPLPDAQSMFMNPDRKVYATKVFLDGDNPELRTGMSCRAEILIQELASATYVPIQAVVRVGGQPTAYVRAGDGFAARNVALGLDNSSMVHVVSGIAAGEVVSLAPPLDTGTMRIAATPASAAPRPAGNTQAESRPAVREAAPPAGTEPERERGQRAGTDDVSAEERAARRQRFQNMSPEEREAEWRKRLESMTPEQREEAMRRMRERQAGGGGDGTRERGNRGNERGADGAAGGTEPERERGESRGRERPERRPDSDSDNERPGRSEGGSGAGTGHGP